MKFKHLSIDSSWTLFLDRDGVINKRLMGDYVKTIGTFEFLPGVLVAVKRLSKIFGTTVIVTNQQGIGKELMTEEDLDNIHGFLKTEVEKFGGKIDQVYFAPQLANEKSPMRKPQIGMAIAAQNEFPHIQFNKCLMVGDTLSDMEFGKNAGMTTILVGNEADETHPNIDFSFTDLLKFSEAFQK
mgnify:CR=1 FL=1